MNRLLLTVSLLSTTVIGACDHYSERLSALDSELGRPAVYAQNEAALNSVMPAAGESSVPYERALAQAYYARAVEENQVMDYKAAKYFTGKAYSALHGEPPAPAQPSEFGIAAQKAGELAAAREKLVSAMQTHNTPVNQDALIAAQVNYDGWVDQVSEQKTGQAVTCRDNFMQALAQIEDPYAEQGRFAVSFDPAQGTLSPQGQQAINAIITLINQNPGKSYQLVMRGPSADAVSSQQFDAVMTALTAQGVNGNSIIKTYATPPAQGIQPVGYAPDNQATEVIVKFAREAGASVIQGAAPATATPVTLPQ